MGTLQAELGGVLEALRSHTQSLFCELSQSAALERQGGSGEEAVATHLAALASLDRSLVRTLSMAAQHQANQAKLEPLVAQIQERDALQRASIAHVAALRSELQALVDAADAERDELQTAEDGTVHVLMQLLSTPLRYLHMRSAWRGTRLRLPGTS